MSLGRRAWVYAGAVALVIFAVAIVVSFLSAANDNARTDRLKSRGISVTVTVTDCVGNLGGSGSNAASYTCRGRYSVRGTPYEETIGAMAVFAAPGAHVAAVADPSRPSTVITESAVRASSSSSKNYVAPALLSVLFVLLASWFFQAQRRSRSSRRPLASPAH